MAYASVEFIYFILSAALVFYTFPVFLRPWSLLLASGLWMASWKWEWAVVFFLIANLNFFFLRVASKGQRWAYPFLIGVDILCFFLLRSGGIGGWSFIPPYGTSFILFMMMGLAFERWRNQDREDYRWVEYVLYSQFFLFLMGGPIEKGSHFLREIRKRADFRIEDLVDGLFVMGIGLIKFAVLWNLIQQLSTLLQARTTHWVWFLPLGFVNTWKVYLELSSLADLGRGAARIFGIRSTINFRPVIFSKSPADYWLRWNISVGTWIRNNVTIPLMLNYGRKIPKDFIILGSFIVMGIWHGVGWNFVLFGLFNGAVLVFSTWGEHRKWPAAYSVFLALLLMTGNGLVPHVFDLSIVTEELPAMSDIIVQRIGVGSLITLGGYFLLEFYQERKKDVDFYLSWPFRLKGAICLILIALFFYALDQDLFAQQKVNDLPIYFKM